jgi:hypothetical protein
MAPSIDFRKLNREVKFLAPCGQGAELREWARARFRPDPNAETEGGDGYRVTSLYFDTENYDVFHRRGSFGRSKHRIRRYGSSDCVFLERKLRTGDVVVKRRSLISLDELELLDRRECELGWEGEWFHRRLAVRRLKPVCQISYHRTALEAGPLRLTMDSNIGVLRGGGIGFYASRHAVRLLEKQVIVELKYAGELPGPFREMIEEFRLAPQAVSKYRMAATMLGFGEEKKAA